MTFGTIILMITSKEYCNPWINVWYWGCAVFNGSSIIYHGFAITEIRAHFMRRRTERIGWALELILFVWFIVGNVTYYESETECDELAPTVLGVMLNLIILSYIRLLRIVTLVMFFVLCCPIIALC